MSQLPLDREIRFAPGVRELDEIELVGERLILRPVRLDDVNERYVAWLADPMVNRYLETRWVLQTQERIAGFVAEMRASAQNLLFAMIERDRTRHIGNIKLGPINPHHRTAVISLFIGEKDAWGSGFAAESIRLVTEYARRLGLRKLTAGCYDVNIGSARAFARNGFEVEGRQQAQYLLDDGTAVDELLLGILL